MGSTVTDSRGSKAGLRLEALRGVGYRISRHNQSQNPGFDFRGGISSE